MFEKITELRVKVKSAHLRAEKCRTIHIQEQRNHAHTNFFLLNHGLGIEGKRLKSAHLRAHNNEIQEQRNAHSTYSGTHRDGGNCEVVPLAKAGIFS